MPGCFAVALRPSLRPARASPCSTHCLLAWRSSERREGFFPGYLWSKIKMRDDMHFFFVFLQAAEVLLHSSLLHFCNSVGSPQICTEIVQPLLSRIVMASPGGPSVLMQGPLHRRPPPSAVAVPPNDDILMCFFPGLRVFLLNPTL